MKNPPVGAARRSGTPAARPRGGRREYTWLPPFLECGAAPDQRGHEQEKDNDSEYKESIPHVPVLRE